MSLNFSDCCWFVEKSFNGVHAVQQTFNGVKLYVIGLDIKNKIDNVAHDAFLKFQQASALASRSTIYVLKATLIQFKSINKGDVMQFLSTVVDYAQQGISTIAFYFVNAIATFKKHPIMHASSHPIMKIFQEKIEDFERNQESLKQIDADFFDRLQSKIKELKSNEGNDKSKIIQEAIASIALEKLNSLEAKEKDKVFETVYFIGCPTENAPNWGEENACKDTPRLLEALDRNGHLGRKARYCKIWENYEKNLPNRSDTYTLNRRCVAKGQVSYINGLSTQKEVAAQDATRISDNLVSGHDINGVYNTSKSFFSDIQLTVCLHGGIATTPVKLLLNQWMNFFSARGPNEKYLQICHSQGSVHVKNALDALEPKLRKRVCVIAIAPAIFIPAQEGCEVLHFVKSTDLFGNLAKGRSRIPYSEDIIQVDPNEEANPHDPHGQNYTQVIKPYVDHYLSHNSLK